MFPHAPLRPVTINAAMVMRAWYDVFDLEGRREDEAGVRASPKLIEALIARERDRGIPAARIVLGDFRAGVHRPERLARLAALSCYLSLAGSLRGEANAANRDVPIFGVYGSDDAPRGRRCGDQD